MPPPRVDSLPLGCLSIVLASDCNLRCSYCYQNAKRPGSPEWPVLRHALRLALASSAPSVRIVFTGGEPLLEYAQIRRAVRYVEARRQRRPAVRFELCTNGTLLGRREARFVDRHGFTVQLSFDGVERAQDLRGPGTFATLDRLLARLRAEQSPGFLARLEVAMTVLPETIPLLARSVEYFLDQGIEQIAIQPGTLRVGGWRSTRLAQLDEQFARMFASSLRHYRRTGRVPVQLFRRSRGRRARRPVADRVCGVGAGQSLVVDVDGGMAGCLALARSYQEFPRTPLGRAVAALPACRVTDRGLSAWLARYRGAIDRIPAFTARASKYSSLARCGTCPILRECTVCPMAIVLSPGRGRPRRVPDFVCAFTRVRTRYARRFPPQDVHRPDPPRR